VNNCSNDLIFKEIYGCSQLISDPAGRSMRVVCDSDSIKLAKKHTCSLSDIYTAALTENIWPMRYIRNHESLSVKDQLTLAESNAAVIGCGGLGSYVVMMLARIGIGSMVIVDPDVYDESNLNRQAFAVSETIGMPKTEVAVSAVNSINPAVCMKGIPKALTESNALKILQDANVVVDALDNIADRKMLSQICQQMKLPLIHGTVAGFEGRVMSFKPDNDFYNQIFYDEERRSATDSLNAEYFLGTPSIASLLQDNRSVHVDADASADHYRLPAQIPSSMSFHHKQVFFVKLR